MSERGQPTVFCAWCRRVIQWGESGIAHGLCEACLPTVAAELDARLNGDDRRPAGEGAALEEQGQLFAWW